MPRISAGGVARGALYGNMQVRGAGHSMTCRAHFHVFLSGGGGTYATVVRMQKVISQAAQLALEAAASAIPEPDAKPWNYGWCSESYRRSGNAAISSPNGPIALPSDGVEKYEALMALLQRQSSVRERWDPEELWGIVASLVAFLSVAGGPEGVARSNIEKLVKGDPSVVVFPVANIDWQGPARRVGKRLLIGVLDREFAGKVAVMGGRAENAAVAVGDYIDSQSHRRPMVGVAATVPGQGDLAFRQAQKQMELLVDISILLDRNKSEHSLYSIRGGSNRPGARGLALDRTVIDAALEASGDSADLACEPFISDALGLYPGHHWYSAHRVPLETMLSDEELRKPVERCLAANTNITRRIQVAARWFAESFWAVANDDSALAAGVALDALVGARAGLPGRAMKERYAFLEADRDARPARAREYEEIYSVRSAVAHGGESQKIHEGDFVREMQGAVTWAAWRLLEAEETFCLSDNKGLESLFEEMRWGTRDWPAV
jgi:hypothetical protein